MWLFGKKKETPKQEPQQDVGTNILALDQQIRVIELKVSQYEKQCNTLVAEAKEALKSKDKKKATLKMKKKKMIEKELSKFEGQQMMLET